MCLSHASGSLALRHLHPGDWLGRPDSLTLRVNGGGLGTYYNPLVDKREHLMEPWSGLVECNSERGDATTQLRLEVRGGMSSHDLFACTCLIIPRLLWVSAAGRGRKYRVCLVPYPVSIAGTRAAHGLLTRRPVGMSAVGLWLYRPVAVATCRCIGLLVHRPVGCIGL